MKKLEHLKALVEWGEEARKAWQEELAAGERDNNILERFKLEDDAKFKVNCRFFLKTLDNCSS